jgi:Zn-dependent peptidase ImmA (M78 family)
MENIKYIPPQEIEKAADKIRQKYDGDSILTDVTRIARENKIEVYEVIFNQNDIDGMIETKDNITSIYVNKANLEVRKRFTIAHEIGHYVLHLSNSNQGPIVDYRKAIMNYSTQEDLIKETQANMFASALLLPKEKLEIEWNLHKDIEFVANLFQVSRKALLIRLDNLGLI